MAITITWHGHGTFTLDFSGTKVVVDPFFAGNNPLAKTAVDQVEADYILQTHGHSDHIADMLPLAKRTSAMVITNYEICTWTGQQGHNNHHAMNTGGGYQFPFGHVTLTPAMHSSGLPDGTYGGDPGGFIIKSEGKNIYLAGDTALFRDMELIGRVGLDLAILPIGDNYTMGPDDSIRALEYLKPSLVIPCHYNTWPVIAVDVEAWANRVRQETAARPVVLAVEESFSL